MSRSFPPPILHFGRTLPAHGTVDSRPDWIQANPAKIEAALARGLGRPTGGWFVLDASRSIASTPRGYVIDGHELVAWRHGDQLRVAPAACPHMGADLCDGRVRDGNLICPWHGLSLGPEGHGAWRPFPAHDDGVLSWVRLPEAGVGPTDRPPDLVRPGNFIDAVIRVEATCEPQDVLANRLDPWHGAHFHPHSFARLRLLEANADCLTVRVSFRVWRRLCVEVDAQFHAPTARAVVMTIVQGEGTGSVVETHATPLGSGRTAIVEATLATSDRGGFRYAQRLGAPLRRLIHARALRLWREDAAYAERRFRVRARASAESARPLTGGKDRASSRNTEPPPAPRWHRPPTHLGKG